MTIPLNTSSVSADVLIIGGGHAGLAAALVLYRSLHTSVIFDAAAPRNGYEVPVRLLPTWEGRSPRGLQDAARDELSRTGYTRFVHNIIKRLRKLDDGRFEALDDIGNHWSASKVLFAIGAQDVFPGIAGYADLYAHGIYPCMFQFGFELRGSSSAGLLAIEALANPAHAVGLAHDGYKFAKKMTIYTSGNTQLAHQISTISSTSHFSIDNRVVIRFEKKDHPSSGVVLHFEDGTTALESFLVHRPSTRVNDELTSQLGIAMSKMGGIEAQPPFWKTSVPGVFAAGDCASPLKTYSNAMTMGSYAGCGLSRELPKSE